MSGRRFNFAVLWRMNLLQTADDDLGFAFLGRNRFDQCFGAGDGRYAWDVELEGGFADGFFVEVGRFAERCVYDESDLALADDGRDHRLGGQGLLPRCRCFPKRRP